jgi:hypothetical protein
MNKLLLLKNLIWIDAIAATLSGLIVITLRSVLAPLLNLPESLLLTLSIVSFIYASFSFYLAQLKSKPRMLLTVLIAGNMIYTIVCIVLLIFFYHAATPLGIIYFLLEASFVAALALLEWRAMRISTISF